MNKTTATRRVLGKGLSALIPGAETEENTPEHDIVMVDYSSIKANPYQPRQEFDDEEIRRLAESIETQGLLQPILVRQKSAKEFEIISGERRYRALGLLKRATAPCVVRAKISDREMMEMALVENIQREDLNEIEKADAYQRLILNHQYTHEELAKQVGKSRTAITNTLRLLNLPQEIQGMVRRNQISMGHARALLSIDNNDRRAALARRIVEEGLSVRAIEQETQGDATTGTRKKKAKSGGEVVDPDMKDVLEKLRYIMGTAVSLRKGTGERGVIEIEYYSKSDCTRVIDILLSKK